MENTSKNTIPIVLSFDQNMVIPAGVCITSLMMNASPETFYDFIILYSPANLPEKKRKELLKLEDIYPNCRLSFFNVGNAFQGAYEIRDITICTYYRLLLPDLMDKINEQNGTNFRTFIYMDVDIVVECDLTELYNRCLEQQDVWIFGVCESPLYWNADTSYCKSISADPEKYINAGVLVMNAGTLKRENFTQKCLTHQNKKYVYQDQDIINIVCKGHIKHLPLKYNFTWSLYHSITNSSFYELKKDEITDSISGSIIHYTGEKPWNSLCLRFEIWWYYYEKSLFRNTMLPITLYESIPQKVITSPEMRSKTKRIYIKHLKEKFFK